MAYNEKLAVRVREMLGGPSKKIEEKKMFGGLCFMLNDKMCLGVESERLLVRVDPEKNDELLKKPGCVPMNFTGKPMKGFVFVNIDVLNTDKKLQYWVDLAIEYNKIAKPSKKKSPK
jgi:TfoX/Sxy family transcriptional regulator of competence genes